jgi:IMP dehydrogenase
MKEYGIGGIPIVDENQKLRIVTNRDLRFEKVNSRPIIEYDLKPDHSCWGTSLEQTEVVLHEIENYQL